MIALSYTWEDAAKGELALRSIVEAAAQDGEIAVAAYQYDLAMGVVQLAARANGLVRVATARLRGVELPPIGSVEKLGNAARRLEAVGTSSEDWYRSVITGIRALEYAQRVIYRHAIPPWTPQLPPDGAVVPAVQRPPAGGGLFEGGAAAPPTVAIELFGSAALGGDSWFSPGANRIELRLRPADVRVVAAAAAYGESLFSMGLTGTPPRPPEIVRRAAMAEWRGSTFGAVAAVVFGGLAVMLDAAAQPSPPRRANPPPARKRRKRRRKSVRASAPARKRNPAKKTKAARKRNPKKAPAKKTTPARKRNPKKAPAKKTTPARKRNPKKAPAKKTKAKKTTPARKRNPKKAPAKKTTPARKRNPSRKKKA